MPTASLYIREGDISIDPTLHRLVSERITPGLDLRPEKFWETLAEVIRQFGSRNRKLLEQRESLSRQIDSWHREHRGAFVPGSYQEFLREIRYLVPEPEPTPIDPRNVDPEIAVVAAPQLVVPVSNARFAINAANARWGSLYDALYGTQAIAADPVEGRAPGYDRKRGAKVLRWARDFMDRSLPLVRGSHHDVVEYRIRDGALELGLKDGTKSAFAPVTRLAGWTGDAASPACVLLSHHGLHVEVHFDRRHEVGRDDPAGIKDVVLESAVTTIQDFEDSVAAVDGQDKARVYANWLGLTKGDLSETFSKQGQTITRTLNGDRRYSAPAGGEVVLPGRSLLIARNVGIHMYSDAVLDSEGQPVPEGILDAMFTCAIGLHDLAAGRRARNSRTGSLYVVKPKLHGPEEVAFVCEVFACIEAAFGLPQNVVKIGIMDEERRTSANLAACIAAARERVIFVNTGFLDRTGDEIRTCMQAGAVVRKAAMRAQRWMAAYENRNVGIALAHGFKGRAQIGKGMWAAPDQMHEMLQQKIAHPRAGATTAWVPSPTAATLHATHYHEVDVAATQEHLMGRTMPALNELLILPLLAPDAIPAAEEIQREIDNNVQGILGYLVRWIDQGVGCSKVPDIDDVGLMEDRATLRISTQHIANWLEHRVCTAEQVFDSLARMAAIVDRQNAADPAYRPMLPALDRNLAYCAATELIFQGALRTNGYTETTLHAWRRKAKAGNAAAR